MKYLYITIFLAASMSCQKGSFEAKVGEGVAISEEPSFVFGEEESGPVFQLTEKDNEEALPDCNVSQEGKIYWVTGSGGFLNCKEGSWQKRDLLSPMVEEHRRTNPSSDVLPPPNTQREYIDQQISSLRDDIQALPVSAGPQGPSGPQGATGPQGPAGAQGPAGSDASLNGLIIPATDVFLYVAKTGSDANDGTSLGSAFLTIGAAIEHVRTNYLAPRHSIDIIIGAGTYNENINLDTHAAKNITLLGDEADPTQVVVQGSSITVSVKRPDEWKIKGMTIRGGVAGSGQTFYSAIWARNRSNLSIDNVYFGCTDANSCIRISEASSVKMVETTIGLYNINSSFIGLDHNSDLHAFGAEFELLENVTSTANFFVARSNSTITAPQSTCIDNGYTMSFADVANASFNSVIYHNSAWAGLCGVSSTQTSNGGIVGGF